MATAAVFFADGFEEIEALSPVDYLRRAGVKVITVGVKGMIAGDTMIVKGSHNVPLITDMSFDCYIEEYDTELPDCVICPGGTKGAENLGKTKKLLEHLEKAWENGKIVSAICASPAVVLGKTSIPAGKKWTCYTGMESVSKKKYINGYINQAVVEDGNLITARGAGASEEFAMTLVKRLAGEEMYNKVHSGTLQR